MEKNVKLSKKLFMELKQGQYIMDNYVPSKYEPISDDLINQWKQWRGINGNTVTIFDSKEECLKSWWRMNSSLKITDKSKAIYSGKLNKERFFETAKNYFILCTQAPFYYIELHENRDEQWDDFKEQNGLMVRIFKNRSDCILERNSII